MRQTFILCYALVLYVLTTLILVLVPVQVDHLDIHQITLLVILGILGYTGASIAFYVWYDERKTQKHEQRF